MILDINDQEMQKECDENSGEQENSTASDSLLTSNVTTTMQQNASYSLLCTPDYLAFCKDIEIEPRKLAIDEDEVS